MFGNVYTCLVHLGAKLCHVSSTFKVIFMALGNYWTHSLFNTFAPNVLNSLHYKKCAPVLYTNLNFSLYVFPTSAYV